MNASSSRSHLVLTVHAVVRSTRDGSERRGKLHLVDLAGSERVGKSGVVGEQLREAQHINKSLSSLEQVILALQARGAPAATGKDTGHVPYRNSKLTLLLSDALGAKGSCAKTMMIMQVSPAIGSAAETLRTLRFGERCQSVTLGAVKRVATRGHAKAAESAAKAAEVAEERAARLQAELIESKRSAKQAEERARTVEQRCEHLQEKVVALQAQVTSARQQSEGDRARAVAAKREAAAAASASLRLDMPAVLAASVAGAPRASSARSSARLREAERAAAQRRLEHPEGCGAAPAGAAAAAGAHRGTSGQELVSPGSGDGIAPAAATPPEATPRDAAKDGPSPRADPLLLSPRFIGRGPAPAPSVSPRISQSSVNRGIGEGGSGSRSGGSGSRSGGLGSRSGGSAAPVGSAGSSVQQSDPLRRNLQRPLQVIGTLPIQPFDEMISPLPRLSSSPQHSPSLSPYHADDASEQVPRAGGHVGSTAPPGECEHVEGATRRKPLQQTDLSRQNSDDVPVAMSGTHAAYQGLINATNTAQRGHAAGARGSTRTRMPSKMGHSLLAPSDNESMPAAAPAAARYLLRPKSARDRTTSSTAPIAANTRRPASAAVGARRSVALASLQGSGPLAADGKLARWR